MKKFSTQKMAMAALLIAAGVVCSPLNIPIGASKCFPIQHFINILAAVLLGPAYGVTMAFATSLLRMITGMGSVLAFPGSMCGALLCGLTYRATKNLPLTYVGELFGTGILGALCAYPLATMVMGKEAALFSYVLPFIISSAGGTAIAAVLLTALRSTKILQRYLRS